MFGKKKRRLAALKYALAYLKDDLSLKEQRPDAWRDAYCMGICSILSNTSIDNDTFYWFKKQRPTKWKHSQFYDESQKKSSWWWDGFNPASIHIRIAFLEYLIKKMKNQIHIL